jgi:hypothetical protein
MQLARGETELMSAVFPIVFHFRLSFGDPSGKQKTPSERRGCSLFDSPLIFQSFLCRNWHLGLVPRLPRLHRAGPSASLDKSYIQLAPIRLIYNKEE